MLRMTTLRSWAGRILLVDPKLWGGGGGERGGAEGTRCFNEQSNHDGDRHGSSAITC